MTYFRTVIVMIHCHASLALETSEGRRKITYQYNFIEWNFGLAYLEGGDVSFPFPGTSVLFGGTHINTNNFIFEFDENKKEFIRDLDNNLIPKKIWMDSFSD